MKLTKCMYGDPSCQTFGLQNNQIRGNSVINSAGWYNMNGERLGSGDLSLVDMASIAKSIGTTDIFIALPERDASWDLPSHLEYSAPGKDYIMQKAAWVIAQDPQNGSAILRIRDDLEKPEVGERDGVKFIRYPRSEFYKATNYTPKKVNSPAVPEKKKTVDKLQEAADKLKAMAAGKKAPTAVNKPLPIKTISGKAPVATKPGGTLPLPGISTAKPTTKPIMKSVKKVAKKLP